MRPLSVGARELAERPFSNSGLEVTRTGLAGCIVHLCALQTVGDELGDGHQDARVRPGPYGCDRSRGAPSRPCVFAASRMEEDLDAHA